MGLDRNPFRHLPSGNDLARLPADGGEKYNRLVFENSPYLLQHATNPVDWYAWGEDAFAAAVGQDKPVFLSIGYATCHWCHVMERETFEDDEAAAVLNRHFICIKVDKEERPDIDDIYMTACQLMTGHGGWPLTIFLDHDRRPFFAGTYFPKRARGGRIGMQELAERVGSLWRENLSALLGDATSLTDAIAKAVLPTPGARLTAGSLDLAQRQLASRFDRQEGGFGHAPKFPTPHNFLFLLRRYARSGEAEPLDMTVASLDAMRRGGIFDHVGFGFHRYSTDQHWLLPHFEKMLYDQALLAAACLETGRASGKARFFATARDIFTYVLRDMTDADGGFYSAEDADSEGEEGKFYVWRPEGIEAVLGKEDGALFCQVYHIEPGGNFTDEATGARPGDSIPHLREPLAATAGKLGMEPQALAGRLEAMREKLFRARQGRVHPLRDDKVLTDWNGLMIAAMALGARYLQDPELAGAARRAADFLLERLRREDGRLVKRYRLGQAGLPGHLDDYAFAVWGLVELYQCCFETRYLAAAVELTDVAIDLFRDPGSGAFFLADGRGENLIARPQKVYDGAVPSGNSAMAWNLARLARMTGREPYEEAAWGIVKAFAGELEGTPSMSCFLMCALDFLLGPVREIVLAVPNDRAEAEPMLDLLSRHYLPRTVVLVRSGEGGDLGGLAPFTRHQPPRDGQATAYVCENHACQSPVTSVGALREQLGLPG